jgi:hypothetical protein
MPQRLYPMEYQDQSPVHNTDTATEDNNLDVADEFLSQLDPPNVQSNQMPQPSNRVPQPEDEDNDVLPNAEEFIQLVRQTSVDTHWISYQLPQFQDRLRGEMAMLAGDLEHAQRDRYEENSLICQKIDDIYVKLNELVRKVDVIGTAMIISDQKVNLLLERTAEKADTDTVEQTRS